MNEHGVYHYMYQHGFYLPAGAVQVLACWFYRCVMGLVGHDSKQMSAHYTHVGREAMQKAAASLPVL